MHITIFIFLYSKSVSIFLICVLIFQMLIAGNRATLHKTYWSRIAYRFITIYLIIRKVLDFYYRRSSPSSLLLSMNLCYLMIFSKRFSCCYQAHARIIYCISSWNGLALCLGSLLDLSCFVGLLRSLYPRCPCTNTASIFGSDLHLVIYYFQNRASVSKWTFLNLL